MAQNAGSWQAVDEALIPDCAADCQICDNLITILSLNFSSWKMRSNTCGFCEAYTVYVVLLGQYLIKW